MRVWALILVVSIAGCSVSRPGEDATGEETFQLLCANCHGVDLEGNPLGPAIGPGSNAAERPDAFLEFAIVNGKGSMPSFESVLDDAQVGRLIDYIREVQAG